MGLFPSNWDVVRGLHLILTYTLAAGVAESGDDFTKFSRISQWFQTLIHPTLMQSRAAKV
ncbi:Mobile element protein [Richelia intracellularis]|nr:Mobile element protein [Richelia intracellularis]